MQNLNPRSSKVHIFSQIFSLKGDPTYAHEILVCEGAEIPSHRVILAARSILFKNIFSNKNFTEGQTQRISFSKMKLSTLEDMLSFVYTDSFGGSKADLPELLINADMYQMPQLLKMCEQKMLEQLTVGNSVQLFIFTFKHQSIAKKSLQADKKIHLSKF